MNEPIPNLPLLRKVVDWAQAEAAKPDHECAWDQSVWKSLVERPCGTAYCIAGYTAQISGGVWSQDGHGELLIAEPGEEGTRKCCNEEHVISPSQRAATLLGLTPNEAGDLFEAENGIADIREIADQIAARAGERL